MDLIAVQGDTRNITQHGIADVVDITSVQKVSSGLDSSPRRHWKYNTAWHS